MSDFYIDLNDSKDDGLENSHAGDFEINRSVFNQIQFAKKFVNPDKLAKDSNFCSSISGFNCSVGKIWTIVCSILPILSWLPKYSLKKDLVRDVAGGLTVGIMQIPQGMAYAMLTTLPPIYGLYVSFVPVLVYFLFGTSRHVSLGTFAIVCLMSGDVIEGLAGVNQPVSSVAATGNFSQNATQNSRVEIAVTLACFVGVIQFFLGILRLGFLTIYLSDPLVSGFTTGAAFHILSSQVRHFLGLSVPAGTNSGMFALFKLYAYFFTHLSEVNFSALIVGALCTIILFILKFLNQKYKFKFPIPAELIVVILGAGISYGASMNAKYATPILMSVPKGLPPLTMPSLSLMGKMISGAFTIAIVSFAINLSLVKSFAKKNEYQTDSNQELIAYGLANIVSSFFSCFPSAVSLSRSLVQESLGSTQITGLISVVMVLLVLLAMAPLFQPLPNAVLAAIVLVALKGLFKQFAELKHLWKISKIDAFIWFSSFLAVFCLGVDYGLAVGIVVTLLTVVGRTSRPSYSVLGRIPGTEIYKSIEKYKVVEVPNMKIFKYKSSLYYANVEHFISMLTQCTTASKTPETDRKIERFSVAGLQNIGAIVSNDEDPNGSVMLKSYEKTNGEAKHDDVETSIPATTVTFRRTNSISSNQTKEDLEVSSWRSGDKDELRNLVIDCSQCGFIDSMGVATLGNIVTEYKKKDIEVFLSNCSDNVLDMLDSGGFMTVHGRHRLFLTVHDVVVHCLSSVTTKNNKSPSSPALTEDLSTDLNDIENASPNSNGDQSSPSCSNAGN